MYKSTSDSENYLQRTGSHATKEMRTGRIDAIPAWAQPAEDYYNSLKDRYHNLVQQLDQNCAAHGRIKAQLAHKLPYNEATRLAASAKAYGEKIQALQEELARFKEM